MSQHLLLISIGPIQDFIASARRTRDLWFGSHLLSEIARGAARSLAEGCDADLIFPALRWPEDKKHFEMCEQPLLKRDNAPLNIANKIVAIIPEGRDPADAARQARQGALATWRGLAQRAFERADSLLRTDVEPIWNEQLDSVLEYNAAWTTLTSPDDYNEARALLEAQLAARKNLREFSPWRHDSGGYPKSSLDGARVSVLHKNAHKKRDARKLRLTRGEELDAIGLVKRAGGEPHQFIPLVNVAYAPWIAHAEKHHRAAFQDVYDACQALYATLHRELGQRQIQDRGLDWIKNFPFDAHLLNPDRHDALKLELHGDERSAEIEALWSKLTKTTRELIRKVGRAPNPYVACLLADGDKMGVAIDGLKMSEAHKTFSKQLATFASGAHLVVERKHRGILVYSGGDDVLAFVALEDAAACAEALRLSFLDTMRLALPHLPQKDLPTLSVGLGVGHVQEAMGSLRELAKLAEKLAKGSGEQGRNALAIVLDKRSGGQISWRERWDEKQQPIEQLQRASELLDARYGLSSKKVYQLRDVLNKTPEFDSFEYEDHRSSQPERWAVLLAGEVRRTLGRSHIEQGESLGPEEVGLDLSGDYGTMRAKLERWINKLLIARTILDARPPAPKERS